MTKAFVPLQFESGKAHRYDVSKWHLVVDGVGRELIVAHLKLCHSKAFVFQAYQAQSHEMLFDAHARAFSALVGIPRRGIYDNMKTAMDKVKKGKAPVLSTRIAAMTSYHLFDPDVGDVARVREGRRREKRTE